MELNWKVCRRIAITAFVLWLAIHYWDNFANIISLILSAAIPLILGCIIAYVVNILMNFYENKLLGRLKKPMAHMPKRVISMILAFFSIMFIIFFVARMVIPEMINCFQIMMKDLPQALENSWNWAEENWHISKYLEVDENFSFTKDSKVQNVLSKGIQILVTGVGGALEMSVGLVSSVFSTLTTVLIALIFSMYVLGDKEKIKGQCDLVFNHFVPKKIADKVYYVLDILNDSFHSFIVGQCIEAVILGVLCMIGMLILRLPYAAMVGCLIGFTALIPIAGAYIGTVVGAFLIFTVSPIKALIFVIFLLILQQIEGNLIYPRVVGSAIGLPGIWVLAAVVIGGGTLGVVGMLLGVPIASALYRLLKNHIYSKNQVKS